MPTDLDPAVSVCFVVTIDNMSLGAFNSCEGLGCEVVMEQREEGGNNGYVWQLPTRIKFSTIKLSRPVTPDTAKVAAWFGSVATGVRAKTGQIRAMTADGTVVAQWGLLGVMPVRWTGPSLNAESPKVAVETIEITHHGFVEPGKA
ncbi:MULTISPECIES: phage tail protein [Nocardia]|uniref:phage tail protein n=1 Tax=Nocardia TaxID=1817 RepID=UPI0007A48BEE|nr:phage tail protein [Nocardia pseudovaccinii]